MNPDFGCKTRREHVALLRVVSGVNVTTNGWHVSHWTQRPRLRQWEKGGYAAEQPYMPMLGPLSLSRLLLRWASLACSCCHSATLGEAMTAFTVRAT